MKYIKLYKECLKLGTLPEGKPNANGLCSEIDSKKDRDLIRPTQSDIRELLSQGLCAAYWASDMKIHDDLNEKGAVLSNTRLNLILFLAAYHEEL